MVNCDESWDGGVNLSILLFKVSLKLVILSMMGSWNKYEFT